MDLKTAPRGGFEIAGNVRARSTQLFNTGVRDLLGGNAVTTAAIRYGTDGIVRFSQLRLTAPRLRVTSGQGRSEERRVGKECVSSVDLGGRRIIKKKNTKRTSKDQSKNHNKRKQGIERWM